MNPLPAGSITALVLAGGRATRMGGIDKGLQMLNGTPLALHALSRLQSAQDPLIATYAVNANRHLSVYEAWGYPVWPDTLPEQPGPLAGMLAGLRRCTTPWLLTVPCDAPNFPLDLADRLVMALRKSPETGVALVCAPDERGVLRRQPVFALIQVKLADHLEAYIRGGGRKVGHWMSEQRVVDVPFSRTGDDAGAFVNLNTLESLHAMASQSVTPSP